MSEAQATVVGPDPTENNGICLLSLDGGGVRGLSALYILKGVMDQLIIERRRMGRAATKPCEIFDLMGGTSTGGLISIMLGRLEMSVEECIDACTGLIEKIFGAKVHRYPLSTGGKVQSRFYWNKLREAMEDVLARRRVPSSALLDDGVERGCKMFVCAVSKSTTGVCRLRSYASPSQLTTTRPTIPEAALASSAATGVFDPVTIGVREYVDGALGANNPVYYVEREAMDIWCPESADLKPLVKCFISTGTGNPGKRAVEDRLDRLVSETLIRNKLIEGVSLDALRKTLLCFVESERAKLESVVFLIKENAHLNVADAKGWTSLIHAAHNGRLDIVEALCATGRVAINRQENRGRTALIWAAIKGHVEVVRLLVRQNPKPDLEIKDTSDRRVTAFYYALLNACGDPTSSPHVAIADILYHAGAEVYTDDGERRISLHWFSRNGKHMVVDWFINNRLDLNNKNLKGHTPVMVCCLSFSPKHPEEVCRIMKKLLSNGADSEMRMHVDLGVFTALSIAAMHNCIAEAQVLIEARANVNAMGACGWTPLTEACEREFPEFASILVDNGAYLDTRNDRGNKPLHQACVNGRGRCAQLLLGHRAKPSSRNDNLQTPLHFAARTVRTDIVESLLKRQASVNGQYGKGYTPLSYVGMDELHFQRRLPCGELLLEHGADVSLGNKDGWTPLGEAAFREYLLLIKAFLKRGANPNQQINRGEFRGETPLFRAAGAGRLKACRALIEEGHADVGLLNAKGERVIDVTRDPQTGNYFHSLGQEAGAPSK